MKVGSHGRDIARQCADRSASASRCVDVTPFSVTRRITEDWSCSCTILASQALGSVPAGPSGHLSRQCCFVVALGREPLRRQDALLEDSGHQDERPLEQRMKREGHKKRGDAISGHQGHLESKGFHKRWLPRRLRLATFSSLSFPIFYSCHIFQFSRRRRG